MNRRRYFFQFHNKVGNRTNGWRPAVGILILGLFLFVPLQFAEAVFLEDFSPSPTTNPSATVVGVSDDGTTAVGSGNIGKGSEAVKWTKLSGVIGLSGNTVGLPSPILAWDASFDGSVVVGALRTTNSGNSEAFRWTEAEGVVGLGHLPGGIRFSEARAVSADGSIIVGASSTATASEAFRWTSEGGMAGLGILPGAFSSIATDITPDGSVIVGWSGTQGFKWTSEDGMVALTGPTPPGVQFIFPVGVSDDGTVIVGHMRSDNGDEAFRWTEAEGFVGLGDLPGGSVSAVGRDVSGDGSLVIGTSSTGTSDNPAGIEPFVWDATNGMRSLKQILQNDFGLDITGWKFGTPHAITSDGKVIVGNAVNPDGRSNGFIASLITSDGDNDGFTDDVDNCPTLSNLDQLDLDGDGIGDVCDVLPDDFDNDGVADDEDNCPAAKNPDQSDSDTDGIGNICDVMPNGGDVVVTDLNGKVVKITSDGTQTVISSVGLLVSPASIDSDSEGNLIIADFGSRKLIKITQDGIQTEITSEGEIIFPAGVRVDSNGDYIVVDSSGKLIKVTPDGDQTLISAFGSISNPLDVALDPNGDYILADNRGRVIRVAPDGAQTVIYSGPSRCDFSQPILCSPSAIRMDSNGDFIVVDSSIGTLFKVTPGGDVAPITNQFVTSQSFGLEIDTNGDFLVTARSAAVYRIDPPNIRTDISSGVELKNPRGIVIINRPPVANDDSAQTLANNSVEVDVLDNDSGPKGDLLSIDSISAGPSNGIATVLGTAISYSPDLDFVGTDSFDYTISDERGRTATAAVTITVISVAEAVQDLVDEINNDSSLDGSVIISLTAPLGKSIDLLNDPNLQNDNSVCGKIGATLNEVAAKEKNGQLAGSQVLEIREALQAMQSSLGC